MNTCIVQSEGGAEDRGIEVEEERKRGGGRRGEERIGE